MPRVSVWFSYLARSRAANASSGTNLPPTWYTDEFAELATRSCVLAIGSKRTMDAFGAGAARPADNHTAIIEFRVEDLDQE